MLIDRSSYPLHRFRWVFCQLEVLRHCLPASIRQTLDQLPESLDETYVRVLSEIPQANQAHAHRMLQCLLVAVRPLRVEELAELLAFEFDAEQGGIPKYRAAWRLDNQTQAVLSTCSSLVTIINDDRHHWTYDRQVVQFSHFSVKEFLMSNRLGNFSRYHIHPLSAHTILTQACLGLLLHLDDRTDKTSVKGFPLADYAARHWVEHARFEDVASHVKEGMETLFDSEKPHFAAWVGIYDMDNPYGLAYWLSNSPSRGNPNPLYYSVLCGFFDLIKHIAIKQPRHANSICGNYRFPLFAALGEDRVEVVELLLEYGANVDAQDATGETILLKVLLRPQRSNLVDLVKLLLKHGADVNAQDGTLRSSLHLAEYEGRLEVAQMLVKHKANVNSQDNNGKTPLDILLERKTYDEDDILDHAELLLKYGAEANRRDKNDQMPLHLAMDRGWFELARILLDHGADANAENNRGMTPLDILLNYDEDEDEERQTYSGDDAHYLAELLLECGAEANRRDKYNQMPLHLAMEQGRFELARILLDHGADANAKNNRGKTPLDILLERWIYSEDDILNHARLLLERGAEVNRRGRGNQTPLLLVMVWGRFKLARILLEHGADANAEDNNGKTPLDILLERRMYSEDNVLNHAQLLLERGATVNRRDKENQTPLLLAMAWGWFKLARILLEHGADANAENNNGKTPLDILLERQMYNEGNVLNPVRLLLEHGADTNRRGKDNRTMLLRAIVWGWFKLARILLEHGADANAEDNSGKPPLHILLDRQIYDKNGVDNVLKHSTMGSRLHGAEVNERYGDKKVSVLGKGMCKFK